MQPSDLTPFAHSIGIPARFFFPRGRTLRVQRQDAAIQLQGAGLVAIGFQHFGQLCHGGKLARIDQHRFLQDDNLYDVLALCTRLLAEQPALMIPAFDRKKGVSIVFKLLLSHNELVRVPALKMLGYFLCRSTHK